jgi:DNA-nicking Smr family endonuclease
LVKKRDISEDERALWEDVMRDVRRAKRGGHRVTSESKRVRVKVGEHVPIGPPPAQPLKTKARNLGAISGVDGATAERLRRGQVEPEATLDLHGMTQQQAYTRLLAFVRRGHDSGRRCLLVVTGKGSDARADDDARHRGFVMPERSKAGVLRSLVPHWLEEAETRPMVVGIQAAHQRHGGSGALYVYLTRRRER